VPVDRRTFLWGGLGMSSPQALLAAKRGPVRRRPTHAQPPAGGGAGDGSTPPELAALMQPPVPPSTGITLAVVDGGTTLTESATEPRWVVASCDHENAALQALVGTTHGRLRGVLQAVHAAQVAAGSAGLEVAVKLPEVVAVCDGVNCSVRGRTAILGATPNGESLRTQLKPSASISVIAYSPEANSELQVRDIRIGWAYGEEPEDIAGGQIGDRGVSYGIGPSPSRFVVVNCIIAGIAGDNVGTSANLENLQGTSWRFYDCELFGGGTTALKHNVYIHDIAEFVFVRSISYASRAGHALKLEACLKSYVIDSWLCNHAPVGTAWYDRWGPRVSVPFNPTSDIDLVVWRSVIEARLLSNGKPNKALIDSSRKTKYGGFNDKQPPVAVIEPGDRKLYWRWDAGGTNAAAFWGCSFDATNRPAGTAMFEGRSARGERVGANLPRAVGDAIGNTEIPDAPPPYTRVDLVVLVGAYATPLLIENARHVVNYQFVLDGESTPSSLPDFIVPGSVFAVRPAGAAWDHMQLNPKFYNKADPDYFWDKITDANGDLDYTATDWLTTRFLTDTMFVLREGVTRAFSTSSGVPGGMFPCSEPHYALMLPPPWNRPQGPTAEWPDRADAHGFNAATFYDTGGVIGARGTNVPLVPNNCPWFLRDLSIATPGGQTPTVFDAVPGPGIPSAWGFDPVPKTFRLDPAGTVHEMAQNTTLPTQHAHTRVAGAHAAGATTLSVASVAGIGVGQGPARQIRAQARHGTDALDHDHVRQWHDFEARRPTATRPCGRRGRHDVHAGREQAPLVDRRGVRFGWLDGEPNHLGRRLAVQHVVSSGAGA
jgi:hypothetical protein